MQRSSLQALQALRLAFRSGGYSQEALAQRFFSAAPNPRSAGDVPDGHVNSDLNPTVCHIGLGRRRDLTLRQNLCIYKDGKKLSLAEVFRGRKAMLVGFPGGPVCTEKQIPGYVQIAEDMAKKGLDKVVCVTVDSPENVQEMAKRLTLSPKVEMLADKNGGLIRLLGLEYGAPEATSGPRCHRFAGIVEDGVLLKLHVEDRPAELRCTDAKSMEKLWDCVYSTEVSDARIKNATAKQ